LRIKEQETRPTPQGHDDDDDDDDEKTNVIVQYITIFSVHY